MAGKSFADQVRAVAKQKKNQTALDRINRIEENAKIHKLNLSSKQTLEQQDNKTSGQVDKQASGQLSRQLSEQLSEQLSGQLSEQVDKYMDNRTSEQVLGQLDNRTSEQVPGQLDNRTSEQNKIFFPPINFNKKPKDLHDRQYVILHYIYFNRPYRVDGPKGLAAILKIPYGSIRNNIRSLTLKEYIEKPFSANDGIFKGSTCRVNEKKCMSIFGPTEIIQPESKQQDKWTSEQVPGQLDNRTSEQVPGQLDNRTSEQVPGQQQTSYNKLVVSFKKLTNFLNNEYWQEQGITIEKFKDWERRGELKEFHSEDFLIMQLEWLRYKDEVEKSVKKSALGLYHSAVISGGGGIGRPEGYLTPKERCLKIMQEEQAREKAIDKEFERVQKETAQLKLEDKYQKLINQPTELQKVIDQANKIVKENPLKQMALSKSLKKFRETNEIVLTLKNFIFNFIKEAEFNGQ